MMTEEFISFFHLLWCKREFSEIFKKKIQNKFGFYFFHIFHQWEKSIDISVSIVTYFFLFLSTLVSLYSPLSKSYLTPMKCHLSDTFLKLGSFMQCIFLYESLIYTAKIYYKQINIVGYREVAIQMFLLALKTQKAALETPRIPSSIHNTSQRLTGINSLNVRVFP